MVVIVVSLFALLANGRRLWTISYGASQPMLALAPQNQSGQKGSEYHQSGESGSGSNDH